MSEPSPELTGGGEQGKSFLFEWLQSTGGRLSAAANRAQQQTETYADGVATHVRTHPALWVAGAFATGLLVGVIAGRSGRRDG